MQRIWNQYCNPGHSKSNGRVEIANGCIQEEFELVGDTEATIQ